jgi:hypothetical protein
MRARQMLMMSSTYGLANIGITLARGTRFEVDNVAGNG